MIYMTSRILFPVYLSLAAGIILFLSITGCDRQPTHPRQPIQFSHKIHVTDFKIDCQYCHSGVRRGAIAGIPSVKTCMGCHQLVAATKPEIIKLREIWERSEPIRWKRVTAVADFVYFNHYPHISKGVSCEHCHGDIAAKEELMPNPNLHSMTWCVDCHKTYKASIDCYICHR
jgi:hypothetical protein